MRLLSIKDWSKIVVAAVLLTATVVLVHRDTVYAQVSVQSGDPIGHETLSGSGVLQPTLSAGAALNAKTAICIVETNDIRYWDDTTNPTTTVGLLHTKSATAIAPNYLIIGASTAAVGRLRMIATAGSTTVSCNYYR